MKNRFLPKTTHIVAFVTLCLWLFGAIKASYSQDAGLLDRINGLRNSLGLQSYSVHSALTTAAQNHARWMVDTAQVSHTQSDGSTPRDRARAAGYPSSWVSENIYMGGIASSNDAWSFWVNSPVHYAGLTNPNYDNIGIGTATGQGGQAFVLVFGNSTGAVAVSAGNANLTNNNPSAGNSSPRSQPSYVVGLDAVGNIMHEVQAGDTLGDIALIYGYTWADIPYMLNINGLTEADIRQIKVGSVFLVPPKNGTYTPTPDPTATSAPPTETPTPSPTITPTPTVSEGVLLAPATFVVPSPVLMVRTLPPAIPPTPTEQLAVAIAQTDIPPNQEEQSPPMWLIALMVFQLLVLFGATIAYFLHRNK